MTWVVEAIIAITALSLLASAFFSTAEVAIFSIRSDILQALHKRKDPRVAWIEEIHQQPRKYLVAILLGNVLSNAVVTLGVVFLCDRFLAANIWISILVTVTLLLVLGELVPKALGTLRVRSIAPFFAGTLRRMEQLARPFTSHLDRLAQQWSGRFMSRTTQPLHGLTDEEYITMLDIGTREGTLRPAERRLIERTILLANRNLRELMTPRSEMGALDVELDLPEMKQRAAQLQHRRIPIYSGSPDSVIGVLNARNFLLQPEADPIAFIDPPAFVPETMTALELLKNFLRGPQRMAMVVDEFGGVEGLITLEDIVEEVFGEIQDEYDQEPPAWEELEPQVYLIRGRAHLPEVSRLLNIPMEADGIDTLGGWLTDRMGALPKVGEDLEYRGVKFQVEAMQRLRVGNVLVRDMRRKR